MPSLTRFSSYDGTELAYSVHGEDAPGEPVVCLPGGPMQDTAYLGDLGGLSVHRPLLMLDLRGTGHSAAPDDPETYRCDRQVADLEALRAHLGAERLDLLAHCAGANLAALYAAAHPAHVRRLALVTPSTTAVGLAPDPEERLAVARLRASEPWFEPAYAALEALVSGHATADHWQAVTPFLYGRWDPAAHEHHLAQEGHRNDRAAALYAAESAFTPDATRAALGALSAPVLLLAGETDLNTPPGVVQEYAGFLGRPEYIVQPHAGHFPWLDAPATFVATVATFLG